MMKEMSTTTNLRPFLFCEGFKSLTLRKHDKSVISQFQVDRRRFKKRTNICCQCCFWTPPRGISWGCRGWGRLGDLGQACFFCGRIHWTRGGIWHCSIRTRWPWSRTQDFHLKMKIRYFINKYENKYKLNFEDNSHCI